MSDSSSQATGVFQLYSYAPAGLGQHLTEPLWQSLMAELRGCRGKSSSPASVPPASQRVKWRICLRAWNASDLPQRDGRGAWRSRFYAPTTR